MNFFNGFSASIVCDCIWGENKFIHQNWLFSFSLDFLRAESFLFKYRHESFQAKWFYRVAAFGMSKKEYSKISHSLLAFNTLNVHNWIFMFQFHCDDLLSVRWCFIVIFFQLCCLAFVIAGYFLSLPLSNPISYKWIEPRAF